jgi:hypothetical protein
MQDQPKAVQVERIRRKACCATHVELATKEIVVGGTTRVAACPKCLYEALLAIAAAIGK